MNMRQEPQPFFEVNPLLPVGPAENLFISGASIFEITVFEPPLQRVTVVGVNLPEPDTFGPYDTYVATLTVPTEQNGDVLTTVVLEPTAGGGVWAGTTFLTFGGTIPPIEAEVRPRSLTGQQVGPVILQGTVFGEDGGAVEPVKVG